MAEAGAEVATPASRDGLKECIPGEREKWQLTAARFEGVKQAAEFFGRRPRRFALLPADAPLVEGAKRVHLVRHGEGLHNEWRASQTAAGRKPFAKRHNMEEVPAELHDPHLTAKGRSEAELAQEAGSRCKPELLVTSPVRRAVETMQIVFKDAVAAGVPALAHELCREQFKGLDPSIYDGRKARSELAQEFPGVDFARYVLPEDHSAREGSDVKIAGDDPVWWHTGSVFGACEGGCNEATIVENAWGFLRWLMARPEREIAVATHSLFLLALHHGALEPESGGAFSSPQFFHTAELRSVVIVERDPPVAVGAHLSAWAPALVGAGLQGGDVAEVAGKAHSPDVASVCGGTTAKSRERSRSRSARRAAR